jgi:DNA polymerase-3 subunit beta
MGTALMMEQELRLQVPQRSLRAALALVAFAAKLDDKALTSMVLLSTTPDGTVTVAAAGNGLRIAVRVEDAVAEGIGAVAVPGRLLPALVELLPDEPIALVLDGGHLLVANSANRSRLVTTPLSNMPEPPKTGDPIWQIALPVAALRELLSRVAYAMGTDATRPMMAGVFLELAGGQLTATASNGHRLATASIAVPTVTPVGHDALLKDSTVAVLCKLLDETTGETLTITRHVEQFITVSTASVTITMNLLEGPFPSYGHLLPSEASHPDTVLVERRTLASALERVALLSPMESFKVEFAPTAERDGLRVRAMNADRGVGGESVGAQLSANVDRQAFNARYFLDALAMLRGNMIAWRFKSHNLAVVFDETVDGVHARHLLMPTRRDEVPVNDN